MNQPQIPRSPDTPDGLARLQRALCEADAIILGAGDGLSKSAGFSYEGERFQKYFGDFGETYLIDNMYSGAFYPFPTLEEKWGYLSRFIYLSRYMKPPRPVYEKLLGLVGGKPYFVLTTNADHQFQKAGFDKEHIFSPQGDYGLWQCSRPCLKRTYDNKSQVVKMVVSQGLMIGEKGELLVPEKEDGRTDFTSLSPAIPSGLLPYCPVCGEPMSMNLRHSGEPFVEDQEWTAAAERYSQFLADFQESRVVFLELGVGWDTPGIIKMNFWRLTQEWAGATYACINQGEAFAPEEIFEKSICLNGDVGEILSGLLGEKGESEEA